MPRLLCNSMVHCRVQKCPLLGCGQCQLNPAKYPLTLMISGNASLPRMPMSLNRISSSCFSPFIFAYRFPPMHAACTSQLCRLNLSSLYPSSIRRILQSLIFGSGSCLYPSVASFLSVDIPAQYL
jgi:hypothetical protein